MSELAAVNVCQTKRSRLLYPLLLHNQTNRTLHPCPSASSFNAPLVGGFPSKLAFGSPFAISSFFSAM